METFIVERVEAEGAPFQHFERLSDAKNHANKLVHDGLAEKAFVHAVATENALKAIQMVKSGNCRIVGAAIDLLTDAEKKAAQHRKWRQHQNMDNHVDFWVRQEKAGKILTSFLKKKLDT